jgi:hypothetical protein
VISEPLEVLRDGDKMEFVSRAVETLQAQSLEPVVGFEACKACLDSFSLSAGLFELGSALERESIIAGRFVHVARDLARYDIRAALRSQWARTAIEPASSINPGVGLGNVTPFSSEVAPILLQALVPVSLG